LYADLTVDLAIGAVDIEAIDFVDVVVIVDPADVVMFAFRVDVRVGIDIDGVDAVGIDATVGTDAVGWNAVIHTVFCGVGNCSDCCTILIAAADIFSVYLGTVVLCR
jgi:hypothetical protein